MNQSPSPPPHYKHTVVMLLSESQSTMASLLVDPSVTEYSFTGSAVDASAGHMACSDVVQQNDRFVVVNDFRVYEIEVSGADMGSCLL